MITSDYSNGDSSEKLARLEARATKEWENILNHSRFVKAIQSGEYDKRLYGIYMIETYHYTLHNSRNQALVGVRSFDVSPQYLNFCFDHAAEEAGHELMAIHDLRAMGYKFEMEDLPRPMLATENLVAYLYWISDQGNPLQRLGYSYWAETSYHHINPVVGKVKADLNLIASQMTFFEAHSEIDEKHAEEVRRMISKQTRQPKDWEDIERVMVNSLRLTGAMLEDVMDEYARVVKGESKNYPFL